MRNPLVTLFAAFSLSLSSLSAATIFSDNFDAQNGGNPALNFVGFANWTVSGGAVDLIGAGSVFDFQPGNGLYVDMDGSSGNAGKLTSNVINLTAGNYRLYYDLAGNFRNTSTDSVAVAVEVGVAGTSHSLTQMTPFSTFWLDFTLASDQAINISFEGAGSDNIGMLLDNVRLDSQSVPDTAGTLLLVGGVLTGLGFLRRRR